MNPKVRQLHAKELKSAHARRLRREVAELESLTTEQLLKRARPLMAREKDEWQRARRGRPRKKPAERAARVLFTIEPDLLRKADSLAKARGVSRARLIAEGLRLLLAG